MKFLGLTVNCSLTWTNHINLLIKKASNTCYLIRNIKPYLSISALKMIYHSLFHSIMSYGIMFWGDSPHSPVIFKMLKRVIRILMGIGYRESCRESFKVLKILTLSSQYIFSLFLFVVHNRGYFASSSVYHNINTRQKNDLHLPHVSLTMYQKWEASFFILVLNFLMLFPWQLRTFLATPKSLKLL
jgi:hypothetical protein